MIRNADEAATWALAGREIRAAHVRLTDTLAFVARLRARLDRATTPGQYVGAAEGVFATLESVLTTQDVELYHRLLTEAAADLARSS